MIFNSTRQWEIVSSLRLLSGTSQQLVSTTSLNFESMKRTTLNVLEKLDDAHKNHTKSLQERNDHEQARDLQLSRLSSNLEELKAMGERSTTEFLILESLHYQRMEVREEKIINAHAQTFEWIFDPHVCSTRLPSRDKFVEWLTNGNDIFWIAGKAGSGKSTLMKFLSHHHSARLALQRWADEKGLIIAAFYFWHVGTELQKSQEGLLQSLLHGVLSQCPDIMPQVLCKRWEQCARTQSTSSHWTRAELLKAFSELSHQSRLNKRFCFFIDGLDEYDGDHLEVINIVRDFATSKDVKVYISSRPWNVFTRAFGWRLYPKFHLEDLTRQDIELYVQDMLGDNELFCQLAAGKDYMRCKRLEDAIVSRAQGVFLWVFLVVRSLIEGLTNADRITDLERRLQSLPTDLEAYFRHMLENIEDVYMQQTVQTFHIALHAVKPHNLMTYAMIDELEEAPRYAIELPVQQMKTTDIESRYQDMRLRINARCKDLLQVTRRGVRNPDLIPNTEAPLHPLCQYEVDFLHRTVKDFFQVDDVQRFITSRIPETFNHCILLCHAFLAQIKVAPMEARDFTEGEELGDLIDDLTQYAHQAEMQTSCPNVELLDELANVIRRQYSSVLRRCSSELGWPVTCASVENLMKFSPLGFAVQKDLRLYLTHKLAESLQYYPSLWRTAELWTTEELFADALEPPRSLKYGERSMSWKMVRLLVDWGVRLNWHLPTRRIWDHIIALIRPQWNYTKIDTRLDALEIMTALLKAEAEPYSPQPDRLRWVQIILSPSANWRTGSVEFEAALTRTIVATCERGIDPYWCFKGVSLWYHFIRSIQGGPSAPLHLSVETAKSVPIIIKKFIGLGARLGDTVYYENENLVGLENQTVTDVLTRILTKKDLDALELFEKKRDREKSKAKPSRVRKREKKRRKKERRKNVGS